MLASLSACAQKVGMHEWGYGGPFGASNLPKNPEETAFFKSDGSWNTPYGRFFLEWYSGLLLLHGERLCMVADEIFLGTGVRISAKVAGIHWHYGTLSHPSELTAGYYNTIFRDGYLPIAEMFSRYRVALCCMLLRSSSRPGTTASLLPPIPSSSPRRKPPPSPPFPAQTIPTVPGSSVWRWRRTLIANPRPRDGYMIGAGTGTRMETEIGMKDAEVIGKETGIDTEAEAEIEKKIETEIERGTGIGIIEGRSMAISGRMMRKKMKTVGDTRNPNPHRRNSNELELYKVYKGRVSWVMDTGCFVQLTDSRGKEGLVHVSQIVNQRIATNDVVKHDQEGSVEVILVRGRKLSLPMRDVDQKTGKGSTPNEEKLRANKEVGPFGGLQIEEDEGGPFIEARGGRQSGLLLLGVLDVRDYPMFDEDGDVLMYQKWQAEEEIKFELNEDKPDFLQGQSRFSIDMSPVKIFKNPEGSLSWAAALQSALIKEERRELRKQQQQRTMLDSIPEDLNRPWEDPMPGR
ncbi:hypothetical protein BHE74_00020601 [Ensete ventricosum]|nr:hypothetical protein BHE74_00020601 [Ensete ventricosum]